MQKWWIGAVALVAGLLPLVAFAGDGRIEINQAAAVAGGVTPGDDPGRSVFVGRKHALDLLESCLSDSLGGRGRLVLLIGEPGIGKTRTAEKLAEHARASGAEILVGHCVEGEGAPAYWPWVQIVRLYVGSHDRRSLEAARFGAAAPPPAFRPAYWNS